MLDESTDHCSIRTMYRVLDEQGPVRGRGDRLRHPSYERPELMAPGGCQLWRWDITEIKDTMKWQSFHRYVIINVFSRYVVGWRVADRASDTLAGRLLAETIVKEYLSVEGLTVHADRGLVDAVQAGGSGTTVWRCSRPTRATTTSQPRRGYGKDEGRNR